MTDLASSLGQIVPVVRKPPHSADRVLLRIFYLGDAALARHCLGRPGGLIDIVEVVPRPGEVIDRLPEDRQSGTAGPREILFIEHDHPGIDTLAILQDIVGRALDVAVVVVAEWDDDLAVQALKLGAIDYVARSSASFRTVYFRLKHLAAHAALLTERSRLREAYAASVEQERATHADLERRLMEADAARRDAERRLNDAVALVEQACRHRDVDPAEIGEPSAERETELLARPADAAVSEERFQVAQQQAKSDEAVQRQAVEGERSGTRAAAEQTRAFAQEALERALSERAVECARLEALVAEREAQFQHQIDEIQAEHRRQLSHLPINMCRCTTDGEMTMASQDLAGLLGYDTAEALQKVHLATEVFESGDQLRRLIGQCLASHSSESIETSWKRRDGSRAIVGVVAFATSSTEIDLVVHDITTLRVLEERLRQSHRLEAVGRYATEVAVRCDNLLTYVRREWQEWLSGIDKDPARSQGERLLGEVTRASALVRQLADYGHEQTNIHEPEELSQVLRNLEPVLRRVAGDHVELVLPTISAPITLDVDTDRVERMLVNIAAYGRERLRLGGRLMIEVAPVMLDRAFAAKYPNVRPGAHALLIVQEARVDARQGVSPGFRPPTFGGLESAPASDKPRLDIGALQALVSECGGHLWMVVEPPGHMVLQIHLPRRAIDEVGTAAAAEQPRRKGWLSWLSGARR